FFVHWLHIVMMLCSVTYVLNLDLNRSTAQLLNDSTSSSCSRMKLSMDRFQPLLVDMGIHLRGRDIRVPEHFLDDSQIGPVAEQMRRETVPEQVRIDICLESRLAGNSFNDLPDSHCAQFGPAF